MRTARKERVRCLSISIPCFAVGSDPCGHACLHPADRKEGSLARSLRRRWMVLLLAEPGLHHPRNTTTGRPHKAHVACRAERLGRTRRRLRAIPRPGSTAQGRDDAQLHLSHLDSRAAPELVRTRALPSLARSAQGRSPRLGAPRTPAARGAVFPASQTSGLACRRHADPLHSANEPNRKPRVPHPRVLGASIHITGTPR